MRYQLKGFIQNLEPVANKFWLQNITLLNNFAAGKIPLLNLLPSAKENQGFYLTGDLTGC
ncbi:MAG: hypothetical protein HYW90_02220 [Candidatus Sungbacteria bacterium]|nr:hypothetical protein [Candidatus Sungbacteria bacterium]